MGDCSLTVEWKRNNRTMEIYLANFFSSKLSFSLFVKRPGAVCLTDSERVRISNIMHMCIFYIYMKPGVEMSALDRLKKKSLSEEGTLTEMSHRRKPHRNNIWIILHNCQITKTGREDVA